MKITLKRDFRDRAADLALRKKGDVPDDRARELIGKGFDRFARSYKKRLLFLLIGAMINKDNTVTERVTPCSCLAERRAGG